MNVVCVYSLEEYVTVDKPIAGGDGDGIPFGIAMIATVLRHAGHQVRILVLTPDSPLNKAISATVASFRPRLFCLTAVSTQFPLVKSAARVIKTVDPSAAVVLGGHHATLNPEDAMSCPDLDAICIGEGESAIVEFAGQLESARQPSGIKNLWIRNRGAPSIEKNATAPFNEDLDSLPFIDREIWHPWMADLTSNPTILVGRGCPYHCAYCSNHALRQVAAGRYVRFRSPENIVRELEVLVQRRPDISRVYLEVETIAALPHYAARLFERLKEFNAGRDQPIAFAMNLAPTTRFEDAAYARSFLSMLKAASVDRLNCGLESGSERIRNDVLRRPKYSNDGIVRFSRVARSMGIGLVFYVMIGLPDESLDEIRATVEIVRRCEPDNVFLFVFYPYPGTDLYARAKSMGLLPRDLSGSSAERNRPVMGTGKVGAWRIRVEYVLFYYRAFRKRWPAVVLLTKTVRQATRTSPRLNALVNRSKLARRLRARHLLRRRGVA